MISTYSYAEVEELGKEMPKEWYHTTKIWIQKARLLEKIIELWLQGYDRETLSFLLIQLGEKNRLLKDLQSGKIERLRPRVEVDSK